MTLDELYRKFPTEADAINYYINIMYQGILTCPKCGAKTKVYRYRKRIKDCQCKNCNNTFSIFSGTIFEKSSTDIRIWFLAINLFLNSQKGISARQLQHETGVTYKCAWRMLNRIRLSIRRKYAEHNS